MYGARDTVNHIGTKHLRGRFAPWTQDEVERRMVWVLFWTRLGLLEETWVPRGCGMCLRWFAVHAF